MTAAAPAARVRRTVLSKRPSRDGAPAGTVAALEEPTPSPLRAVRDALAAEAATLDAAALLGRLVTVDGRIAPALARQQLTHAERHAVELLAAGPGEGGKVVFKGAVGYTEAGKPFVDVPGRPPASRVVPTLAPVAVLAWSAAQVERFHAADLPTAPPPHEVRRAREHLVALADGGLLADVVRTVRSTLSHVAPISTYVGHRNLTNLRSPRTLSGQSHLDSSPDCVLRGLEDVPPDGWPDDAALFVSLGHRLLDRWGPNGLEYLNGLQLGEEVLAERAEDVAPGASSTAAPAVRCRVVDGVLRNKRVGLVRHAGPSAALVERLAALVADVGVSGTGPSSWVDHLRAPDALGAAAPARVAAFEHLVEDLLRVARRVTASELAMSRGMRRLDLLADVVRTGDRTPLVGCAMDDQYCCVITAGRRGEAAADRAWAVASRMRYNTWHFRPWGGVRPEESGATELYYPPELPDISAHADFHHPGHINYGVRHALRAPRAVAVDGTQFTGLVDVRLSRAEGAPYRPQDLVDAVVVADLVGAAYEGLLRAELDGGGPHTVQAFDLGWFREAYL